MKIIKFSEKLENIPYIIKAKNSLYKSTYKCNAFTKNKEYVIYSEEDKLIFIIDNVGNRFCFSKLNNNAGYFIEDYFDKKDLELKLSSMKYNL